MDGSTIDVVAAMQPQPQTLGEALACAQRIGLSASSLLWWEVMEKCAAKVDNQIEGDYFRVVLEFADGACLMTPWE